MPFVGGITEHAKDADDEVKEICEKVRNDVETKAGVKYEEFTPIVYKTQLVNGTNYFIKVKVSPESHIHIRVHQSFAHDNFATTFHSHEENKTRDDEITYF